jgi:hypothetical protein
MKNLTPERAAEVKALVMRTMRPVRFHQAATASLKKNYPAGAYPQLLDALRSPLVRSMADVELRQSKAAPAEIPAFVAGLNQTPPDPAHMAIVKRIDQATANSQLTVEVVVAILEGLAAGSSGQMTAEDTRKMVDEVRGQRALTLRQNALVNLLYVYRGVPDDQLGEYANLLESQVMMRFNDAAATGLLEAARQGSAELMQAMMGRAASKPAR